MIAASWIIAIVICFWGPELSTLWLRFNEWLDAPAEKTVRDPAPEKLEVEP